MAYSGRNLSTNLYDVYTKEEADATTSTLNTAIGTKANTTDVNTALGTKVNSADLQGLVETYAPAPDLTTLSPTSFTLPQGTTEPSSPSTGQMFFNTNDGFLRIYNGTDWGESRFAPAPTVSVTTGLMFGVESWNPDCISNTSDGTITDFVGSKVGYATNQRSDSPSNNVSPQMVLDGADVGNVWNFNGGNTPDWWISFPDVSGFPSGSAARTYSCWFKADSVTLNALGGQDGSPTWTNGGSLTTASAYMLCERGSGWEITGHGYDQHIGVSETATNVWVNIVAADDGSTLRYYRNGSLIGSIASTGFNTNSTNFFIGRHWSKEDLAGINGKISSFYVWNRGLSASEALQQYNDLKGHHGL